MSAIKEIDKKYNLHSWSAQSKVDPLVITKAEGIYFWDEDGNQYYDMSSQLVNLNLGHGNKAIIEAIREQALKLPFVGPAYAVDVRSEAAKAIVEASGIEGAKVFFTNAGAESNENAIKIARLYTKRLKVFSMYRAYHGSSAGAGMLTGEPRHWANEPGGPGFVKFEGPYAYRAPKACKFESEEDITAYYLELLENQIKYEGPEQIAAIFMETVVGSNGILIPPAGYLKGVRALCDTYGILMVCDEVMAGWYRTGTCFAFQQFDVKPDLVTFAKGVTCGYVPIGGVIVAEKVHKYFDDHVMLCGLTYSAHPLGCAAAVATLAEYKRLNIAENVKAQGALLKALLDDIADKYHCIGEVRSIGLFSSFELVKDKETREPAVPFGKDPEGLMSKVIYLLKKEGFSTYSHENMIFISPPLTITEEELRGAMNILDKVMSSVDKMIK